jgi:hypothetical protein
MRWVRRLVVSLAAVAILSSTTASTATASGASGARAEGASGASQAVPGCTRPVLQFATGAYLFALVTNNADFLPFTAETKATQNGTLTEPGQGLWQTATNLRFQRSALDTDTCSVHIQALLNDGDREAMVGIRFKVAAGSSGPFVSESEIYVTHQGDYFLFSPTGLLESDAARTDTQWMAPVPEAQRSTRAELIRIADQYFSLFGSNVSRAPFETNCDRWENGQRMTSGSCAAGIPTGTGDGQSNFITNRRYPFADVESGIVVGYAIFAGGLDFHMFKVVDGQVRLITAIVTDSGHTSTGWEEQEGALPPA